MDNGEGPRPCQTDASNDVHNKAQARNSQPPLYPGRGSDLYKEVYSIAEDERNFASDLPMEDVIRMIQLAEGEHVTTPSPIDGPGLQQTGKDDSIDQSSGNHTQKKSCSIFGDERNFASDMPIEDVIRILEAAEGEFVMYPTGISVPAKETTIPTSTASQRSFGSSTSLQRYLNESFQQRETDPPRISSVSTGSDAEKYMNKEMPFQELSHALEAAEVGIPSGHKNMQECGPFFVETDISPTPDPLCVGNVSIIRDYRNYVGDVSLPDVAGVLGAVDEAEEVRILGDWGSQPIAILDGNLCISCSGINLAYGCTHLNMAALKKSAENGCQCCQLIHKAVQDISQFPRRAPPQKPKDKPVDKEEEEIVTNYYSTVAGDRISHELDLIPQTSALWARASIIDVDLARNTLVYKVFDSRYNDGRRYNGQDILKFFEFCESRDDCLPGYKSIFGRLLEPHPASESSFALVFKWIEECKDGHIKCQQHQTLLPNRVIDVWEDTPILVDGQGKDAPYILLSHCWGGEQTITTTQLTLPERKQGIPINTLPKTFRDAIIITRTLGIQYLWIDSLCIIQDLEEDWVSESGNMKDYYRNGYLTISALYSPNSHHGILNPRQDMSSVQLSATTNLYLRPRLPDHQEVFRNAPLNNRAWALQERLLSTCILHYTDTEMFWECQTCTSRESSTLSSIVKTDPDSVITSEGEDFKRVLFNLNDDPYSALDGAYVTWYRLVTNYSTRAITYSSDKLPAISGLASLIQSKIGSTYLHGIWKEDVRGLLWFRDISRANIVAQQSANPALPQSEPPPSWSWASAPGPIRYRYEEAIYSGYEAVILERDFSNHSSQGLDNISYRHLVLCARSRPLIYQLKPRNKQQFLEAALYESGSVLNSTLFVGQGYMDFTDFTSEDTQTAPIQSCTALWIIEQKGDPYKTLVPGTHGPAHEKIEYIKNLMCLLVEKLEGEQGWRRIGVGIIRDGYYGDGKWSKKKGFAIV